jgi:hypothetical protein
VEPIESDGLFTSIGSPGGGDRIQGRQGSIMARLNCGAVSDGMAGRSPGAPSSS